MVQQYRVNGVQVGGVMVMIALVSLLGGLIFGYDTGQISDFLIMDDFLLRFADCTSATDAATCVLSNERTGLIVGMLSVGTMAGALTGASLADRFGRRWGLSIAALIISLGTLVQILSFTSWQQLTLGRAFTGVGVGAASVILPVYASETAPKELRGSVVAMYQLGITFGILLAYCVSIGTRNLTGSVASGSWRIVLSLNILWSLFLGFGIMWLPESPRFLMLNGDASGCETALARVRGVLVEDNDHQVRTSWLEMERAVQEDRELEKVGWLGCFATEHKTLYRTLLGATLQALQQLTGANYFFYYGATIFRSVGISDSFVTQIILGAVSFISTFGSLIILERFGRRRPLIAGGIWQGIWLLIFASVGTTRNPATDVQAGQILIVSAALFIVGYAMTWGPGIWILMGETFPTRSRAKQGAISTATNWLFNFLLAYCTPYVTAKINFSYGYMFAACNLAGAAVVYFFVYESSKLSLEAVDQMYNDPACRPWRSATWCPPGHASRADYDEQIEAEKKGAAVEHREMADERGNAEKRGPSLHDSEGTGESTA